MKYSHYAVSWAFAQKGLKPATRIVLWALAHYANDETGQCWPSRASLADDAEVSEDTIDRHLAVLKEAGLITIEKRYRPDGGLTSPMYTLNFDAEMAVKHLQRNRKTLRPLPDPAQGGEASTPSAESDKPVGTAMPSAPSAKPETNSSSNLNCSNELYPPTPKGEPEGRISDLEKKEPPTPSVPPPKPPSDGRVLTSRPLAPDLAARFDELLRRTEPTLVAIERAFGPAGWHVERNYRLPEDDKGRRRSLSAVALHSLETLIGFMVETSSVLPHSVQLLGRFPGLKVVVVAESADAQAPPEGVDVLVIRRVVKRATVTNGTRAMVFVRAGSPQAEAWIRNGHKATLWKYYPEPRAEGWYFPSEWPPGSPEVRDRAPTAQPAGALL